MGRVGGVSADSVGGISGFSEGVVNKGGAAMDGTCVDSGSMDDSDKCVSVFGSGGNDDQGMGSVEYVGCDLGKRAAWLSAWAALATAICAFRASGVATIASPGATHAKAATAFRPLVLAAMTCRT